VNRALRLRFSAKYFEGFCWIKGSANNLCNKSNCKNLALTIDAAKKWLHFDMVIIGDLIVSIGNSILGKKCGACQDLFNFFDNG
jgi:hypothetical protein